MLVLPNFAVKRAEAQADARSLSYEMLMENAGQRLADVIEAQLEDGQCLIICGKGRNAGDGYVAARILASRSKNVTVAELYPDGYDSLTELMRQRLPKNVTVIAAYDNFINYSDCVKHARVICDAVFGTGFRGELTGLCAQAISAANAANTYRIAADVPSGLTSDCTLYFAADETVAMLCAKDVHVLKPTASHCGKITVADIGIEEKYLTELEGAYEFVGENEAACLLPIRPENAHKGTFGHVLTVAGSYTMPGAAALCTVSALRSGAGLVTAAFPQCAYPAIAPQIPEAILLPLECDENGTFSADSAKKLANICDKYSAIAVGCGMTTGKGAQAVMKALIENYTGTLIVDADAINITAYDKSILKRKAGKIILTPHPGEMSRLTGKSIAETENDRFNIAREFACEYAVTLLLKGHNTLIASPDGRLRLVTSGTNALSRGGAGDMLTGIIAAFASYIDSEFDAAALAAYVHGRAGFLAGERLSSYSCAVGDIARKYIGEAIGELIRLK